MEREDFMASIKLTMDTAVKFKAVMVKRGIVTAQTKCPRCGVDNALQGRLAGRRNHMRMWCKTAECGMQMME